eukprot:TRINITY_DN849_c1_g1_i1.p1 TRINITY_DN849_c1_g1~~TRINITY_DN849_c1_g1_i1.p1  ORF type:complete len:367 (+),score=82.04 TRINITY_DN849_c1_g1_i1:44-1144(+)
MRNSCLLLLPLLFSIVSSYAIIGSDDTDFQDFIAKHKGEITNAFLISVSVTQITNVTEDIQQVLVQFYDKAILQPSNVTGNSTLQFDFDSYHSFDDLAVSSNDVHNIGFKVLNSHHESLGDFNLTDSISAHFPNTSGQNPFKLWRTVEVPFLLAGQDGMQIAGTVKYEGVLDFFGVDMRLPIWRLLLIYAAIKLGFCLVFALSDWVCQPLQQSSSFTKAKIFIGNWLWLFFGGLETGIAYWFVGVIFFITCILAPFGIKLARIGTFALFPFGRQVKSDDEIHHAHVCSLLGNILWLLLIGLPLAFLHFIFGIVLILGIFTIPFGLQHLKLAKIAFMPFGHSVVFYDDRVDPYEKLPIYRNTSPRYV